MDSKEESQLYYPLQQQEEQAMLKIARFPTILDDSFRERSGEFGIKRWDVIERRILDICAGRDKEVNEWIEDMRREDGDGKVAGEESMGDEEEDGPQSPKMGCGLSKEDSGGRSPEMVQVEQNTVVDLAVTASEDVVEKDVVEKDGKRVSDDMDVNMGNVDPPSEGHSEHEDEVVATNTVEEQEDSMKENKKSKPSEIHEEEPKSQKDSPEFQVPSKIVKPKTFRFDVDESGRLNDQGIGALSEICSTPVGVSTKNSRGAQLLSASATKSRGIRLFTAQDDIYSAQRKATLARLPVSSSRKNPNSIIKKRVDRLGTMPQPNFSSSLTLAGHASTLVQGDERLQGEKRVKLPEVPENAGNCVEVVTNKEDMDVCSNGNSGYAEAIPNIRKEARDQDHAAKSTDDPTPSSANDQTTSDPAEPCEGENPVKLKEQVEETHPESTDKNDESVPEVPATKPPIHKTDLTMPTKLPAPSTARTTNASIWQAAEQKSVAKEYEAQLERLNSASTMTLPKKRTSPVLNSTFEVMPSQMTAPRTMKKPRIGMKSAGKSIIRSRIERIRRANNGDTKVMKEEMDEARSGGNSRTRDDDTDKTCHTPHVEDLQPKMEAVSEDISVQREDSQQGKSLVSNLVTTLTDFFPFTKKPSKESIGREEANKKKREREERRKREDERRKLEQKKRRDKARELEERQRRAELNRKKMAEEEMNKKREKQLREEERQRKIKEEKEARKKRRLQGEQRNKEKRRRAEELRQKMGSATQNRRLPPTISRTDTPEEKSSSQKTLESSKATYKQGTVAMPPPPPRTPGSAVRNRPFGVSSKLQQRKEGGPQNYEMSAPRHCDEESSDDERYSSTRNGKRIPDWARQPKLAEALINQTQDPDKIFPKTHTCDLDEIFANMQKKRKYRDRTSSGIWLSDRLTWQEEIEYKKTAGFC